MIKLFINNVIKEIVEDIKSITTRKNTIIINNNSYISEDMIVQIVGDVKCNIIDIGGSLTVQGNIAGNTIDVGGSLKATSNITAKTIDVGGSVNCNIIHGNIDAGGSINTP